MITCIMLESRARREKRAVRHKARRVAAARGASLYNSGGGYGGGGVGPSAPSAGVGGGVETGGGCCACATGPAGPPGAPGMDGAPVNVLSWYVHESTTAEVTPRNAIL
ncbi:unnamed protein product [Toxocara canis]|uniref:Uncharacterized protein n=1 Tax=Toxocara canis TaxID=6265 RepID=A0A183UVJ4_TOXCA|nr:unnamed protein product [Toxocara canis]